MGALYEGRMLVGADVIWIRVLSEAFHGMLRTQMTGELRHWYWSVLLSCLHRRNLRTERNVDSFPISLAEGSQESVYHSPDQRDFEIPKIRLLRSIFLGSR